MKAVIELDVPEWQIGQDVSVYFPDTMLKHGKCELLKEQEAVHVNWESGVEYYGNEMQCPDCKTSWMMELNESVRFCPHCGRPVKWE